MFTVKVIARERPQGHAIFLETRRAKSMPRICRDNGGLDDDSRIAQAGFGTPLVASKVCLLGVRAVAQVDVTVLLKQRIEQYIRRTTGGL